MACDGITPTLQQGTHRVARQCVVIDQHDELRARSKSCGLRYHGRRQRLWGCRDKGHRHRKARTFADNGFQFDWMAQETTKALDNGQSQAKATFAIRIRASIELAEDFFPLLLENSGTAIPDFDAQRR